MPRLAGPVTIALTLACFGLCGPVRASEPDWNAVSKEAVDLLGRYVRLRSVNPPADTAATAAFLKEILDREGIEAKLFESAPGKVNLLARLPATNPAPGAKPGALLLLHHMDVVPVDAARWPVDPFSGEIRDGYLYGRGSVDMKDIGVIHLLAMVNLKRQKVPLVRDVLLMASADEESGGEHGAKWMIEHHWADLAPEYVLDEGGFGARDVLAADGRLVFGVSVAEKKILWGRLVATGTAGHGSQPISDNANDALARALAAIASREETSGGNAVIDELTRRIGDLASNKFTNAIRSDTVSITTLRSGVGSPPKPNVIPSSAEATLDCRLLGDTDTDRFIAGLLETAGGGDRIRFETISRQDDTPVTPSDTPLFAAIERAIRAEYPQAVVAPMLIPYGTDSNAFRVKGAKAYGLTPMVLDASIIASMHSDAERVPVAELVRGVRIFYSMLTDFCGK